MRGERNKNKKLARKTDKNGETGTKEKTSREQTKKSEEVKGK